MIRRVLIGAAIAALGAAALSSAAIAKKPRNKLPADLLRVHFINVGQGDTTVIEGPADARGDRKVLMIDAGESTKQGNEAKHVIEPYLHQHLDDGPPGRPVVKVDAWLGTHYHKDHIGSFQGQEGTGIYYLWDALTVNVGRILDTGIDYDAAGSTDKAYRKWIKSAGVPRETLAFDQRGPDKQIDLGEGVWVEVQSVGATTPDQGRVLKEGWINDTSQNDFSAAVVVHYGKFDLYVAGDLSGYLHESWGNWYHNIEGATYPQLRPVEVYKVDHHGSQWSSNTPFVQRLAPTVGVVSCGKGHHHPNEYTTRRILGWEDFHTGQPVGADIFQTKDVDGWRMDGAHPVTGRTQRVAGGSIVIETDGVTGFRVLMPGQDPVEYPLQDVPAQTDLPAIARGERPAERSGPPPWRPRARDDEAAEAPQIDDVPKRASDEAPRVDEPITAGVAAIEEDATPVAELPWTGPAEVAPPGALRVHLLPASQGGGALLQTPVGGPWLLLGSADAEPGAVAYATGLGAAVRRVEPAEARLELGPDLWWEARGAEGSAALHFDRFDLFLDAGLRGDASSLLPYLHQSEVYRAVAGGAGRVAATPLLQRVRPDAAVVDLGAVDPDRALYAVERLLSWEDYYSGWPTGAEAWVSGSVTPRWIDRGHGQSGRRQHPVAETVVVETDGRNGYSVLVPDQPRRDFALQKRLAWDPQGAEWTPDPSLALRPAPTYGVDDVRLGRVHPPREDDPEGGAD